MDVRDLAFWRLEAQKKIINDQIRSIQAARAAMVKDGTYENILSQLKGGLKKLELGEKDYYRSSWQDLREMQGR